MTINKLCSLLAKLEKTKSQARIQAIRSIVGHLSDILYKDYKDYIENYTTPAQETTFYKILQNGERRAKRKKK